MENQVLSISQMEELVSLGIDVSKASMYWIVQVSNAGGKKKDLIPPFLSLHLHTQKVGMEHFESVPTFILQDILEMLPKIIIFKDGHDANLILLEDSLIYYETSTQMSCLEKRGINMLEAAFNMLIYLKKNNYI